MDSDEEQYYKGEIDRLLELKSDALTFISEIYALRGEDEQIKTICEKALHQLS